MMMMRERETEEWRNGNKKKKKTLYSKVVKIVILTRHGTCKPNSDRKNGS